MKTSNEQRLMELFQEEIELWKKIERAETEEEYQELKQKLLDNQKEQEKH